MSVLSADGKYVTVQSGDSLWGIAAKHLGSGSKYPQLAAINGISTYTKNGVTYALIHPGQKIYLTEDKGGGGSSPASTATAANTNRVTITGFGMISELEDTLYVTWTWSKEKDTDSYKVVWTYDTGDGVEWVATNTTVSVDKDDYALSRQHTYQIPTGAKKVWVKVLPVAITDTNNNVTTSRFTASWSEKKAWTVEQTIDAPNAPSVELKDLTLTVELEDINLDSKANKVEFQLVKNNTTEVDKQLVSINTEFNYASYVWTLGYDGEYKVRCRLVKGSVYGEWSSYSQVAITPPVAPDGFTTLKALSKTSVYAEWPAVTTATSYLIQYTTDVTYFDSNPNEVTDVNVDSKLTHTEITGMAMGDEYFFRMAAVNNGGTSEWTEIKSIVIGTTPSAPTTWSSSTTVVVGEPLNLYWVHNCEDGSKWTYAELRFYVDGVLVQPDRTIENTVKEDDDQEDTVGSFSIDTSIYPEGTKLDWQVRTAGITLNYGEWSIQRTVDIYAKPELEMSVTDINGEMVETLTTFPFYVKALAGPKTQAPLSYHLSIVSNDIYETVDAVGNPKTVNVGEEVYSKHFDTNENPLMVEISASNVDLENNVNYSIICIATMNSGLVAEATKDISVSWVEVGYQPDAAIGINEDTLAAQIRPYCQAISLTYHKVSLNGGVYTVTDDTVSGVFGSPVSDAVTTTGEQVYQGTFPDGTEGYYCTVETKEMVDGIELAVYRREFDGTFTEIAKGVRNVDNVFVTDPHPSLDYARYRIVATTTSTGAVCHYDVPAQPVGCKSVVIQWSEGWSSFDASNEDALAQPPWSGSMLKLPYNIDVSDNNRPDVALIEYIGRTHPISYYGTQIGQTSTWNVSIPKSDKETLYTLRRLAIWMGDVYVREPSGSGYWANITVSSSQRHKELTIPVTLSITRVEGGM